MKKIPTLFKRDLDGDRLVMDVVTPGCEWVLAGEGRPTEKIDGTACLIQNDILYKRYELKAGKTPPVGFTAAQEADPVTGEQPGWIPVSVSDPQDRWHVEGLTHSTVYSPLPDGTYELIGPKVQGNPYHLPVHFLVSHELAPTHGDPRTFADIRAYLEVFEIEGIVWWHEDGRKAKIKRKDFGLEWPIKERHDGDSSLFVDHL